MGESTCSIGKLTDAHMPIYCISANLKNQASKRIQERVSDSTFCVEPDFGKEGRAI